MTDIGMYTRGNMRLPLWAEDELGRLRLELARALAERDTARDSLCLILKGGGVAAWDKETVYDERLHGALVRNVTLKNQPLLIVSKW